MSDEGSPLKVDEAAVALSSSETVIRRAIRAGRLPAVKIGREWLVPRAAVERLRRGEPAIPTS